MEVDGPGISRTWMRLPQPSGIQRCRMRERTRLRTWDSDRARRSRWVGRTRRRSRRWASRKREAWTTTRRTERVTLTSGNMATGGDGEESALPPVSGSEPAPVRGKGRKALPADGKHGLSGAVRNVGKVVKYREESNDRRRGRLTKMSVGGDDAAEDEGGADVERCGVLVVVRLVSAGGREQSSIACAVGKT